MKPPKINGEIDDHMNAMLIVTCGDCNRKTKFKFSQLSPGKIVKCGCGSEFSLTGADFKKTQQELDNFKRDFDKL